MRKTMLFLMAVTVLSAGSAWATWAPMDWDISYIADILPDASGSIRFNGTPWSSFARGYTPSTAEIIDTGEQTVGEIYHQSTMGGGSGACYYYRSMGGEPAGCQPDSTIGYTFEWRVKLNDASADMNPAYCAFTFEEATPGIARYWAMGITRDTDPQSSTYGKDYVAMFSTSAVWAVVDPGWHTYRLTVTNDGMARLYIDGSTTPAIEDPTYSGIDSDQMRFGDFTGDTSDFELDYFAFDCSGAIVPEPVSLMLLGLGGLAALRRRK